MHNTHKHSWAQRQKEVKKILKQRTQEWKEKQSLYQLMRSAAASQNPLLSYRKRNKDAALYTQERDKISTGNEVIPRSAFNWYPGFVTPTDLTHIRPYPVSGYPMMPEYDPNTTGNARPTLKRRYHSGNEKSGSVDSFRDPMIKEVLSLANTTTSPNAAETGDHRRSKRARSLGMKLKILPADLTVGKRPGTS